MLFLKILSFRLEANLQFRKHSGGSAVKSKTECDRIRIGCETKWVLKKDHSSSCPRQMIPDTIPDFQNSWFSDMNDGFYDDFFQMPFF